MRTAVGVLGHVAVDRVLIRGRVYEPVIGGPPTYAGAALAALGAKACAITSFGADEAEPIVERLLACGVRLSRVIVYHRLPTTRFELSYEAEGRSLRLLSRCGPLPMPDGHYDVLLVSPIAGELEDARLHELRELSDFLAVDVQGFLRAFEGSKVVLGSWPRWRELAAYIDLLKVADDEARCLVGADPREAALVLARRVRRAAAVTLGGEGALVAVRDRNVITLYEVPPFRVEVTDPTGAGDAFAAVLALALAEGEDPSWACALASAAASMMVERVGVCPPLEGSTIRERAEALVERVRRLASTSCTP